MYINKGKTMRKLYNMIALVLFSSLMFAQSVSGMNPSQLRETVMDPSSRQLVCLSISSSDNANSVMDLLLSKKRAPDRKDWLEKKGSLAEIN